MTLNQEAQSHALPRSGSSLSAEPCTSGRGYGTTHLPSRLRFGGTPRTKMSRSGSRTFLSSLIRLSGGAITWAAMNTDAVFVTAPSLATRANRSSKATSLSTTIGIAPLRPSLLFRLRATASTPW